MGDTNCGRGNRIIVSRQYIFADFERGDGISRVRDDGVGRTSEDGGRSIDERTDRFIWLGLVG